MKRIQKRHCRPRRRVNTTARVPCPNELCEVVVGFQSPDVSCRFCTGCGELVHRPPPEKRQSNTMTDFEKERRQGAKEEHQRLLSAPQPVEASQNDPTMEEILHMNANSQSDFDWLNEILFGHTAETGVQLSSYEYLEEDSRILPRLPRTPTVVFVFESYSDQSSSPPFVRKIV